MRTIPTLFTMRPLSTLRKALLALMMLAASSTTVADSLIYAGVSAGQSDFNSHDDTNYGIHVGTGLLPILDIEAGYIEHGDFAATGGSLSLSSTYAAVRPTLNLGDLQLYAKAGLHYWSLDAQSGVTDFKDENKYDVMWGVGAEYAIFGPLSLGINYTNFRIDNKDLDSINATASFNLF